jgi:hypothetical protein
VFGTPQRVGNCWRERNRAARFISRERTRTRARHRVAWRQLIARYWARPQPLRRARHEWHSADTLAWTRHCARFKAPLSLGQATSRDEQARERAHASDGSQSGR